MDALVTFLEGVVTFVSPCLLPMLPVYVAFFAGGADAGGGAGAGAGAAHPARTARRLKRTFACALGFVLGFTVLFTLMGAFAGSLGRLLTQHQAVLDAVCGVIVVVLGLNYLGVLRIPLLQRTLKPTRDVLPRGFGSSVLFGVVFAVGWTPCVGAFLGSALSLAASSASTARGVGLLLSYSAGLGVPFLLAAVLIDQLEHAFSWVKRHYRAVNGACGALLVAMGLFMATGHLNTWLAALSL